MRNHSSHLFTGTFQIRRIMSGFSSLSLQHKTPPAGLTEQGNKKLGLAKTKEEMNGVSLTSSGQGR